MSETSFEISYDGEALRDHAMDVQQLAPALLGLAELIKEANAEFNGDRAKVRLFVQSDFEHKCFNVNFDLVQTLVEHVRSLLGDESVKTAKDLLEWIEIIGGVTLGGGSVGLFGYLLRRKGRPVVSVKDVAPNGDEVMVQFGDGNTINVHKHIYNLGENPKARKAIQGLMAPLAEEGIDKLEVREKGKPESTTSFDKKAAKEIRESCRVEPHVSEQELEPQKIKAHLKVYAPVYDAKAQNWRFRYGDQVIYADISETDIARDAIARGGALIGDTYYVVLEIIENERQDGTFRNAYKVLEVLEFTQSTPQMDLLTWSKDSDKAVFDSEDEDDEEPPKNLA